MMIRAVKETEFQIVCASSYTGKYETQKVYWIVYIMREFPKQPHVFEKIEDAVVYIEHQAQGLCPKPVYQFNQQFVKVEESNENGN